MTLDVVNFVELSTFTTSWTALRLDDDALLALQQMIMLAPKRHPVIAGTGGLRKMRFGPPRWPKGKRGGLRVCYVFLEEHTTVILVLVYTKAEKDDMTATERQVVKDRISRIKKEFDQRTIR